MYYLKYNSRFNFVITLQSEYLAMVTAFSFGLTAVLVRKGLSESTAVTAALVISGVQVVVLSLLLVLSATSSSPGCWPRPWAGLSTT